MGRGRRDEALRSLGRHLAELRRAAGYNQHTFAPLTGYGRSTVANVETGRQRVPRRFWEQSDHALGAGGSLIAGFDDACASAPSSGPEAEPSRANEIKVPGSRPVATAGRVSGPVNPALVPHWLGMLRALAASHDVLGPRELHEVARGELEIILAHRDVGGDLGRALLGVEARWAEFTSWTADNLGRGQEADYWLRRSLSVAGQAGDRVIAGYVLMRQAQRAVERRDAATATALAESASRRAGAAPRDLALCAVREAQGAALAGDRGRCASALRTAYRLVDQADSTDDGQESEPIGHHCVRPYVAAHEGYCQLALGLARDASTTLETILNGWSPRYRQDEGLARSWLASAYALTGRVEEAAAQGERVLDLATASGSVRMIRALRPVDVELAPHRTQPQAKKFRTRYATIRQVGATLSG